MLITPSGELSPQRLSLFHTIVSRSTSNEDLSPFAGWMDSIDFNGLVSALNSGKSQKMLTSLRHGNAGQFHQLIEGKCSEAHEILIERSGIFGGNCL